MKKLTALLLALLCVILPACGEDAPEPPAQTTEAPAATTEAPKPLTIPAESDYVIIRADEADQAVVDAAIDLMKSFASAGIKVGIASDWEKKGTDPATRHPREILVGKTNREASQKAAKTLRANDYIIETVDDRIVICGGTPGATASACTRFVNLYLNEKTDSLTLERGVLDSLAGQYSVGAVTLGGKPLSDYTIAYTGLSYAPAAQTLQKGVMSATGYVLPIDALNDTTAAPVIVLGQPTAADITRLGGSVDQLALEKGSTEHILAQSGTVLYLAGLTEWTASDAANEFVATYLAGKSGDVAIDGVSIRSAMSVAEPVHADADLRVMTFNVFGTNGDYAARFPYIVDTVRRTLPDIVGFQEANKTVHNQVLAKLYDVYAQVHTHHSNGSTVNYTPILYRRDKLKVIESDLSFLRSRYTGTNTKSITTCVMEVIETGERFIMTNLHGSLISASYNIPGSNAVEGAAWREDNIAEMCEKIDALKQKYGDLPTFSTGDYNFNSTAKAYSDALALGLKCADVLATVSADRGMASYHKTVGDIPGNGLPIDMIFVSGSAKVYVHRIVADPDTCKGSDHCPVYADVSLK